MRLQSEYNFDKETGIAKVMITDTYNGSKYFGQAICHPEDREHMSEYFGLTLAETRANIAILRSIKNVEIKSQLDILQHLYSNMKTSKHFNPKSYEAKMLRRQIKVCEANLETTKEMIEDCQFFIKDLTKTNYKELDEND